MTLRRPCSSKRRGRSRAGHPHSPVGAGSKAAALLRPSKSWQQPTDMAEAAGSERRAPSPRLKVEHRLQGKGGPARLLGSWGPHPWLFEAAGQQDQSPEWQKPGYLGLRPWLFGAARLTGSAHVDNFRDSGVPFLAVDTSSDKSESEKPQGQHSILRTPTVRRKSTVDKAKISWGLDCQRATCTPQVVGTGDGHARTLEQALGSATSGQPYPSSASSRLSLLMMILGQH